MITRIVMMKMIRSTNITSTRGVTLMSAIASGSSPLPTVIAMTIFLAGRCGGLAGRRGSLVHPQAHLGACDQIGVQFVGEVADALLHALVPAQQDVVAQHRGHRDRE